MGKKTQIFKIETPETITIWDIQNIIRQTKGINLDVKLITELTSLRLDGDKEFEKVWRKIYMEIRGFSEGAVNYNRTKELMKETFMAALSLSSDEKGVEIVKIQKDLDNPQTIETHECPKCGEDSILNFYEYCPKCGSKITWK